MTDFDWTDKAIERMRDLHDSGFSMSQIAAGLGGGLTRNAVTGKLHRLGLARGKVPANPEGERARRNARRANPKHRPKRKGSANELALADRLSGESPTFELPPENIDDLSIPVEQRRTLLELEVHHCRWPVNTPGAPDFFFCGSPTADCDRGRPYCAGHAAIAFSGRPQRGAPFVSWRAA